jgi:hypothetical protein
VASLARRALVPIGLHHDNPLARPAQVTLPGMAIGLLAVLSLIAAVELGDWTILFQARILGMNEKPKFHSKMIKDGRWTVAVSSGYGPVCHVGNFATEEEANRWIATDSKNWPQPVDKPKWPLVARTGPAGSVSWCPLFGVTRKWLFEAQDDGLILNGLALSSPEGGIGLVASSGNRIARAA